MTDDDLFIDPQRISDKPQVFEGRAKPGELPRLEESLADTDFQLDYRVTAQLDKRRRKVVSCIIEGFVFLMCQKSLDAFRHGISISDRLVLVDDESQLPPIEEESDAEDYLVADGPMSVLDLVEDAVLLALPMVPRKPGLEESPGGGPGKVEKPSPFAVLESLKKRADK